jgi:hypothetical protein
MSAVGTILACLAVLAAVLFVVLRRLAPSAEIVGVDLVPGEWATLSFRLPRHRAYRLWARVSIDGEHRDRVVAEVEARTKDAVLHPAARVAVNGVRWFDTASCFTLRLWKLPELAAGTAVVLRARMIGVDGTPMRSARLYVGP